MLGTDIGFIDSIFKGWSIYELILNILFILLLLIISSIIYWDTINSKIKKNSRCRRNKDLFDKLNGIFTLNILTKNGDKLFNIDYDFINKKNDITCNCKKGNYGNTFKNIEYRNLKNSKNEETILDCKCDKIYNYDRENVIYNGEPGLIRYHYDKNNTDFFDDIFKSM
jgi:hypothetical protein|tara:strand:- start:1779 stop:2282 length:504 start_codon:yes stop_codon:yes gene_type:complete